MAKVTVACKLPSGFNPEFGGVIFVGSNSEGADRNGGYGITENVDADAYGEWEKRMRDGGFAPVLRGLIFAEPTKERAVAAARELSGLPSGFEALDPDKPADGIQPDAEAMKTGDDQQKAIAAKAEGKG